MGEKRWEEKGRQEEMRWNDGKDIWRRRMARQGEMRRGEEKNGEERSEKQTGDEKRGKEEW